MKKIFYLAIAALAFAACARELAPEAESNLPKVKVSIKAILDQEDVTKAEINMSNGTASWETGDQIAVHTKNGKLATLEAESAGTSVTFSGTVDAGDDIEDGAIAYYPAAIAIEGAANIDKISLPASYASPALSAKGFLMRGVLTGDAVEFKHIGALLKVTINDVPSEVTAVEFTPNGDFSASGEVAVTASGPKCTFGTDAKASVKVLTSASDRTDPKTVIYIPVPTGTLTGGFTVTLLNDATPVVAKGTKSDFVVDRAKVLKMKEFDSEDASLDKWYLVGLFNNWNTTANQMEEVSGHNGWLVAKNITIPNEDTGKGFKFFKNGTWVGGECSALHKQFSGDADPSASNIDYTHGESFDIYYNPTDNKFFLANAGEDWNRTIYMMTDMKLSDLTYYLHIWEHGGGAAITTDPGVEGTTETISGIKYYKFNIGIDNSPAGSYDCAFQTSDFAKRYYFYSGKLVLNDNDSKYYLSFTSTVHNGDKGASNDNPLTMYVNPAKPEGESTWKLLINPSDYKDMKWEDGVLVCRGVTINPSAELMFRYNTGAYDIFYTHSGAVDKNIDFSVDYYTGGRSSGPKFTVPSLGVDYVCDIYLDIINKTAKVVPIVTPDANITLYFGVPNPGTYVRYYTFNGRNMDWNVGIDEEGSGKMTEYETFDGVKYYKAVLPGKEFWNTNVALIVRSDGITYNQTTNFETADWTGYKDEYYFKVVDRDIIQQTKEEARWTYTSQFAGVDWSTGTLQGSSSAGYIADWKVISDASNIYLYYKLVKTALNTDVNEEYIYCGFDTDGGVSGSNAGGNVNGLYNQMMLLYPFTVEGSEIVCVNGTDNKGYFKNLGTDAKSTVKPETYGVIKNDYIHIEVKIPRAAIGSPTGTIGINQSWHWHITGQKSITLASAE